MPASKVGIWNKALAHIGVKQFVQTDSEKSNEAGVLRVVWDSALEYVLSDYPWRFATAYATLGLVEENPNGDWQFAYRYPSDCIHVRRIVLEGGRNTASPPPFTIGQDDQGRLIYTDQEQAVIEYTKRVTETGRFDAKFSEALEWYLASVIATPLSRVDGAANRAREMYELMLVRAAAKNQNEAQQDDPVDAEWIRGRG